MSSYAQPSPSPESTSEFIESDIAATQQAIKAAEAEGAVYTGGLVKSLIQVRLGILRQTEAMLHQAALSSRLGIALTYTIEGQRFVLPESAKAEIPAVEEELRTTRAKIAAQRADTDQYAGGLVRSMGLSAIATMQQTEAMLDQRRLALKYGLPQFVGFAAVHSSESNSTREPVAPVAHPFPATDDRKFEIVGVAARVTESNNQWWKYSWKLTIKNECSEILVFNAEIEFQDADGFAIDRAISYGLPVPAQSEKVFTGFQLVKLPGAANVASTNAKVRLQ